MIYIATNVHGQGVKLITEFNSRLDLICYANEVTATSDTVINSADTIDAVCEKLYDMGMGFGARHHYRVSPVEARLHKSIK